MITEKDTIKCESIFNDDHTHRYLWKRVWDKDKPMGILTVLWVAAHVGIIHGDTVFHQLSPLSDFVRSQALKPSNGIKMRVPIRSVGNPGSFTSSYAFGKLMPI